MSAWTCPACQRLFGRRGQSHLCAPAMTLDEYFATGPAFERPIFDAVLPVLEDVAGQPLHVEPVAVGIFVKHERSWVELRPLTRWVALSFPLRDPPALRRIARRIRGSGGVTWCVVNLGAPGEVDAEVRALLEQSYLDTLR